MKLFTHVCLKLIKTIKNQINEGQRYKKRYKRNRSSSFKFKLYKIVLNFIFRFKFLAFVNTDIKMKLLPKIIFFLFFLPSTALCPFCAGESCWSASKPEPSCPQAGLWVRRWSDYVLKKAIKIAPRHSGTLLLLSCWLVSILLFYSTFTLVVVLCYIFFIKSFNLIIISIVWTYFGLALCFSLCQQNSIALWVQIDSHHNVNR